MTEQEIEKRRDELFEEECKTSPRWFYLSFCDDSRPVGSRWLGACYVQALEQSTAALTAESLGINPGGEVICLEPDQDDFLEEVPESWRNRLLTAEEIDWPSEEELATVLGCYEDETTKERLLKLNRR